MCNLAYDSGIQIYITESSKCCRHDILKILQQLILKIAQQNKLDLIKHNLLTLVLKD